MIKISQTLWLEGIAVVIRHQKMVEMGGIELSVLPEYPLVTYLQILMIPSSGCDPNGLLPFMEQNLGRTGASGN